MAYIGASPPATALTASDIADGIISEAKMANDAISLAELKAGTDGEIISWDASANPVAIGVGTSGHFLKSQGAGAQPVFAAAGGGKLVQMVNTVTGAVATGTTTIPYDDTIPQSGEGVEFMTLAITPTNSSNKLRIDVVVNANNSSTSNQQLVCALFQDSTAGSLACSFQEADTGGSGAGWWGATHNFTHYMAAGTTSSTTFKVRAGSAQSGTTTFNGVGGGRIGGGVAASSITIMEYEV